MQLGELRLRRRHTLLQVACRFASHPIIPASSNDISSCRLLQVCKNILKREIGGPSELLAEISFSMRASTLYCAAIESQWVV